MRRVVDHLLEGVVQRLHQRRVHALGAHQAVGRVGHDVVAQLAGGGHVGPALGALVAEGHQQPHLAAVDELVPTRGVTGGHHVAAQQRLHLVGVALERDVVQLDLGHVGHLFDQQVRAGAGAGGAEVDLARLLARGLDVVLEGLPRRVGAHHEAEGVAGDADDEGEVVDRVPGHLLHVRQPRHAHRVLRQRVAVGLGVQRHVARAGGAAAAGHVLHHHLLAQHLGGDLGQRTVVAVGAAAGGPGHDDGDGARREGLCAGGAVGQRQQAAGGAQHQRAAGRAMGAGVGHGCRGAGEGSGRG